MVAEKNTPLMEQYFSIKAQYPDTMLLFQVGDFYELFFDDALQAAHVLAITLTKRGKNKGQDIPLCGIPVHALSHYLPKLIRNGFKVALCDQLTKPTPGTVVQRGVTQVFTPGTLTDQTLLDDKTASYLLSFFPHHNRWALIFSELLTAQIFATTVNIDAHRAIEAELARFFPDEVLIPGCQRNAQLITFFGSLGYCTTIIKESPAPSETQNQNESSNENIAKALIAQQFSTATQEQLAQDPALLGGMEQLFNYLHKNQQAALEHFKTVHFYEPDDYLLLDPATQRNLDLVTPQSPATGPALKKAQTLFSIIDRAKTPMGSRALKKWLLRPLVQQTSIEQRLDMIQALTQRLDTMQALEHIFMHISDLERIIGRIALDRATVNDYHALLTSLLLVPQIKTLLLDISHEQPHPQLALMLDQKMADFSALIHLLQSSLNDNPQINGIIKEGFDQELDHLRSLLINGRQEILQLESQEISATGISSLKIGFTDLSGYYIEITNTHINKVPERYQHKQTLSNRQRFTTQALKNLEADLFKARNELEDIEKNVFIRVKQTVRTYLPPLRHIAQALAYLDGLYGLADLAYHHHYVRPAFNTNRTIDIVDGRHPVVEHNIGSTFIPNDTLINDTQSLLIITGPNMGGKSTYLRQVALMCILAQMGSFVPAKKAELPLLDRIFTRIGAGDNLAMGKSTFLVEMEETATICTQARAQSLVILDEVGRGTSTYDGMALAQAIIEHIAQHIQARCLFATHYHELTTLGQHIPTIANFHADCKEVHGELLFLHKILPGAAKSSFGVQAARLAHLPESITQRASQLLEDIEKKTPITEKKEDGSNKNHQTTLLPEKTPTNPYVQAWTDNIRNLDFDALSPRQAFELLWELKRVL